MKIAMILLTGMLVSASALAQNLKPMPADAKPVFEVATIRPSDPAAQRMDMDMDGRRFVLKNYPLRDMIAFAYGVHRDQILNGPAWMKDRFDVNGVPDRDGEPNVKQIQGMVQKLLEDRFGLTFHREQRELPMYLMTVTKSGSKMTISKQADGPSFNVNGGAHRRALDCRGSTMDDFALGLQSFFLEKPVVNQTGLSGRFDFKLVWNPDMASDGESSDAPSLFTAFPEQLGLKIEAKKGPVTVLLVDALTRPSEN